MEALDVADLEKVRMKKYTDILNREQQQHHQNNQNKVFNKSSIIQAPLALNPLLLGGSADNHVLRVLQQIKYTHIEQVEFFSVYVCVCEREREREREFFLCEWCV